MALSFDPLWPRAGGWPAYDGAADVAVLGVPAHRTSLSPTGAHATPAAIRDAVQRFSPALVTGESIMDLSELNVRDAGDVHEPDGEAGETRTIAHVEELALGSKLVAALGGDNSVTYAVARGMRAEGLITLDAHYDVRDGVSNGSPVRRLVERGLDPKRIVQIGIADFANSVAYAQRVREWGVTVIGIDEVRRRGISDVIAQALEAAGPKTHFDIDVDVADRSVAPGCPASVPGGLAAWELRALVRGIARSSTIASADITEVDATADAEDGRTVRLAALCLLELCAAVAERA